MSRHAEPGVLCGTTHRHGPRYVPMHGIELILLEDGMLRYKAETTTTAVACRTGAMFVVLLGVVAILAHSVLYGDRQMTVATKAPQLVQGYTP